MACKGTVRAFGGLGVMIRKYFSNTDGAGCIYNGFVESPRPEKPLSPVSIPRRDSQSGEKMVKPASQGKHLSIIKSMGERAEKEKSEDAPEQEPEPPADNGAAMLFRQVASRGSSQVLPKIRLRRQKGRGRGARNAGCGRLLRFYWKSARREIRRFHARFTPKQIIGFYLGVPAAVSLLLCISFFLMKPPRGVTPETVSRRRPAITELIQQIQSDLQGHDPRAALSVVAELEKDYPKDARTYVTKGTVFAHQKDYGEARKSYLHSLEMVKGLLPALINLGEVEFATGNYGLAAAYFEQAGQRLPRNPLIMFRRYLCYSLLNERAKTESVRKELAARPDSVEWYFVQASEALRAGKRSEAQRLITAAGTLFGEQAAAYQESLRKIGWLK